MIFAEFTVLAEKKIEMVLDSQVPRSLSLSLCLYVRMYVCVSVYTCVSLYVYMHLCLYTCHSVCGCVCRAVIVAFFFHRTLFVTFCLITNTSDSDDCCVLVVLFIVWSLVFIVLCWFFVLFLLFCQSLPSTHCTTCFQDSVQLIDWSLCRMRWQLWRTCVVCTCNMCSVRARVQNKDKPLSKLLQRGEDPVFDQVVRYAASYLKVSLVSSFVRDLIWHSPLLRWINTESDSGSSA